MRIESRIHPVALDDVEAIITIPRSRAIDGVQLVASNYSDGLLLIARNAKRIVKRVLEALVFGLWTCTQLLT